MERQRHSMKLKPLAKYILYWPKVFIGRIYSDVDQIMYEDGGGYGMGESGDFQNGDGWGDSPWADSDGGGRSGPWHVSGNGWGFGTGDQFGGSPFR